MNKSCSNISKIGLSLIVLVIGLSLGEIAQAVTITSLKGNVFVILPQGKVQEAHYGQKLPDMAEIMTDESSQVAWRDEEGNFYQLAASGHLRFLNKILELQQGNLWLKVTNPTTLSVQTANSVIDFKKADGIISYEGDNSRTQVLATRGQFVLSNILVPEMHEVINAGQFSFLEPSYEEGMPRVATNVGKGSYKKMTQLFMGHNENGLESASRLPASLEKIVFEDRSPAPSKVVASPAVSKAPASTPQVIAATAAPALLSPASASSNTMVEATPTVMPAAAKLVGQPASANSSKVRKNHGAMQVKTYGQEEQNVQEEKAAPAQPVTGEVSKPEIKSAAPAAKSARKTRKVTTEDVAPKVTPGQIVYYLPDYEQIQKAQRQKVAAFYEQQVAVMAATPPPKKFAPDYTTPSNTTVKVLGKASGGVGQDNLAKHADRAVASVAVESAATKAASIPKSSALSSPEVTSDAAAVVRGSAVVTPSTPAAVTTPVSPADETAAPTERNPASVENQPLEKVTLEQFTKNMRLDNESEQLINELKSYRIDRRGR